MMSRPIRARAFGSAVVILVVSLASAACTGTGSNGSGKSVTLTVDYIPDPAPVKAFYDKAFAQFEKDNPNIKVKTVGTPRDQYANTIGLQFRESKSPDVFQLQRGTRLIDRAQTQHWLHSLNQYVTSSVRADMTKRFGASIFSPDRGDLVREGNIVATPMDNLSWGAGLILWYNPDLLTKYGISGAPRSWNELAAAAKKITQASGKKVYGFSIFGKTPGALSQVVDSIQWNSGDPVFTNTLFGLNLKTGKPGFEQANYADAVQYLSDLASAGVMPPGWETRDDHASLPLYASGKVAMGIGVGGDYLSIMRLNPKSPMKYAPLPSPDGTRDAHVYTLTGNWGFWGMSSKTAHPDQAWKLMQYMMSASFLKGYSAATGLPAADPSDTINDANTRGILAITSAQVLEAPHPRLVNPASGDLLTAMGTAVPPSDIQNALLQGISQHKPWGPIAKALDQRINNAITSNVASLGAKGSKVTAGSLAVPAWDPSQSWGS